MTSPLGSVGGRIRLGRVRGVSIARATAAHANRIMAMASKAPDGHLGSCQPTFEYRMAAAIDVVELKHVLREIDPQNRDRIRHAVFSFTARGSVRLDYDREE
jgi:hypothetical protein